jgi:ubiquinone/menaquinone biosynthesis C-methylase UbiE
MTVLRRLEDGVERLDSPEHEPDILERDFDNIEGVNRWLGGARALHGAILPLLDTRRTTRVLDVGCGSGDVPRGIVRLAGSADAPVRVVGVDRHSQIIRMAVRRSAGIDALRFVRADGLTLPFADRTFDIAMMSLALHHFDGETRNAMLRELARVTRRRVIINDLERCIPNYLGARLLAATLWRSDPLARHDGPLSVLRSFTPAELRDDLRAAGLDDVRVERRFFYRLVASGSPRPA